MFPLALSTLLSTTPLALGATPPQPAVDTAHVESTEDHEVPQALVESAGGTFYVLSTRPDAGGWPSAWISRHDAKGKELWTYHHEIYRTPAGAGYTRIEATASDAEGNLYFGYHTYLNGYGQFLVKLRPDHSVAWETKVDKCLGMVEVMPLPDASDVMVVCSLNGGGTMATRRDENSGEELWRTFSYETGVMERRQHAMLDDDHNIYVIADWDGSHVDDHRRGTVLHKFAPDGTLRWRRQHQTSAREAARNIGGAFLAKDGGVLAAFKLRSTNAIDVLKYSAAGKPLASHRLTTANPLNPKATVAVAQRPGFDHVYVAWDDPNNKDPATEWGLAVVDFKKTAGKAKSSARAAAHPKSKPSLVRTEHWEGRTLRTHRIESDDHDDLVDLVLRNNGQAVLVGVDRKDDWEHVRLTIVSNVHYGGYKTTRYGKAGRHARPTALLLGHHGKIHVLGCEDVFPGPEHGHDADLLRLVLRVDGGKPIGQTPHSDTKPASTLPVSKPARVPNARSRRSAPRRR